MFARDSREPSAHTPAVQRSSFALQTKLTLGRSNDRLELEADRVADAVVRGPYVGTLGPSPLGLQRKCVGCAADDELQRAPLDPEDEEDRIQAKAAVGSAPALTQAAAHKVRSLGAGAPLSAGDQQFFSRRLGHDLSRVRVHADARAEDATSAVRARAFTLGRHVAFARGEYAPGTDRGRHLLAHELTHVVQQGVARRLDRQE